MDKYIDIIVTLDGNFYIAPSFSVSVGDYIAIDNVLTGATEIKEVIAKATEGQDSDCLKLVEAYTGQKLQRITTRYKKLDVEWED